MNKGGLVAHINALFAGIHAGVFAAKIGIFGDCRCRCHQTECQGAEHQGQQFVSHGGLVLGMGGQSLQRGWGVDTSTVCHVPGKRGQHALSPQIWSA